MKPKVSKSEILKMKNDGLTYSQIAKKLGVSRQRVQQKVSPVNRSDIRKSLGDKCRRCGATGVKLDLHHKNYLSEDVELLCVSCHRLEDVLSKNPNYIRKIKTETSIIGRPPLPDEERKLPTKIFLRPDNKRRLLAYSRRLKLTMGIVINSLIAEHVPESDE